MPIAPPPAGSGLRGRSYRAIAWSSGTSVLIQGIAFGGALLMTRMVAPTAFGRVALAAVVVGLVGTVTETGLATALTQRTEINGAHETAAFCIQTFAAGTAAVVVSVLSGPIAALLHQEAIQPVLVVLSAALFVQNLGSIPRALLIRELKMRTTGIIDVCAASSSVVVGVALALAGLDVGALVAATCALAVVSAIGSFTATAWRPQAGPLRGAARELFTFARPFYGYSIINYLVRNGDNMLVGRFLGSLQLGLYSRAYALLLVPSRQTTSVVGSTVQVGLARIASDKERSRRVYLEACGHIAFVVMPAMTLMAVLTGEFVRSIMGSQWGPAIPTVRLLAIVGIIEPVAATGGWLYFAQGRADLSFRLGLLLGPVYLLAFGAGVAGGSSASVAFCYLCASALIIPIMLKVSGGLIGVSLLDHVRTSGPPLLAALGAGLAVLLVKPLLLERGDLATLLAGSALGGCVYLALAAALRLPQVGMLKTFSRRHVIRRPSR